MDALVCNGLGIYLGMKTLNYLRMKPYHWRGMWNIPTYRGKLTRILKQFTPYSWMDFEWRPISSLGRWIGMLGLIGMVSDSSSPCCKYIAYIYLDGDCQFNLLSDFLAIEMKQKGFLAKCYIHIIQMLKRSIVQDPKC